MEANLHLQSSAVFLACMPNIKHGLTLQAQCLFQMLSVFFYSFFLKQASSSHDKSHALVKLLVHKSMTSYGSVYCFVAFMPFSSRKELGVAFPFYCFVENILISSTQLVWQFSAGLRSSREMVSHMISILKLQEATFSRRQWKLTTSHSSVVCWTNTLAMWQCSLLMHVGEGRGSEVWGIICLTPFSLQNESSYFCFDSHCYMNSHYNTCCIVEILMLILTTRMVCCANSEDACRTKQFR